MGACADTALRLWDVRVGALAFTCHGHAARGAGGGASGALAASFSPAGDFFASGGADAQLLVWRTRIDRELEEEGEVVAVGARRAAPPPPAVRSSFVRRAPAAPLALASASRIGTPAPPHAAWRPSPAPTPPPPPPPAPFCASPPPRRPTPSRTPPPPRPHAPYPPPLSGSTTPTGMYDDDVASMSMGMGTMGMGMMGTMMSGRASVSETPSAALAASYEAASAAAARYAARLGASPAPAPPPTLRPHARGDAAAAAAASSASADASEQLQSTLSGVLRQLDVLTQTMALLEERLSLQEARTGRALAAGAL
jgi:hypothetical protein